MRTTKGWLMNMKISVSILKSKIPRSKCIEEVEKTDADFIHVDFMDNTFVKRETFTKQEVLSHSYGLVGILLKLTLKQ